MDARRYPIMGEDGQEWVSRSEKPMSIDSESSEVNYENW